MYEKNDSQLDVACRILTVSSSLAGANTFINRLKSLSAVHTSNSGTSNDNDGGLNVKTSSDNIVPWTIVNRYYVADVHFAAHVIHGLSTSEFDKPHAPPAVIYVWVDGEPYEKYVRELSQIMGGYEPEVSLAVRIPKSVETAGLVDDNSETKRDDNMDIDTTLMSYGFEYIDATGEIALRRTGDVGNEFPSTDDIPHLPRVLDALSTIMWPSMTSARKGLTSSGLDSESKQERDCVLEELLARDQESPTSHSEDEDDIMQMQELVRSTQRKAKGGSCALMVFTEGSSTMKTLHPEVPWLNPDSGKTGGSIFSPLDSMSLSPSDMVATSPFGMGAAKPTGKFSIGFEDDFTVFVSAPALGYREGETTPQQDMFESPMPSAIASSTLEPGSARLRYHSLGSVSDFGGSDFGDEEPLYKSLDDNDGGVGEDDDDLPTREEIRETSAKIFGTAASLSRKNEEDRFSGAVNAGGGGEDDMVPPFDLTQVMSALQEFKTDISGMDDEEERRRAAAKVALGLVYGLGD